jgi:hypothetical protein
MGIWDTVAAPIIAIINKVVPDKAAAAAAVAQLQQMQLQGQLNDELLQLQAVTSAQSDINRVEAASTSLFVAGWRPYVGWICGTGLGLQVIVAPLFTWITALAGHPTPFPKFDDVLLQSTLAGMLGLGYGLRTFEKSKGIAGNH